MKNQLVMIGLMFMLAGCGITAPRDSPGFAELDSLGLLNVRNTMSLSFGPTVLGFAARQVDDDPDVRAMLGGLDGVRIRQYEIRRNSGQVSDHLAAMSQRLEIDGWQLVARLMEADENVHILVRQRHETIEGLTVLALDGREVTVINVMGQLRPENFPRVLAALDVNGPAIP